MFVKKDQKRKIVLKNFRLYLKTSKNHAPGRENVIWRLKMPVKEAFPTMCKIVNAILLVSFRDLYIHLLSNVR